LPKLIKTETDGVLSHIDFTGLGTILVSCKHGLLKKLQILFAEGLEWAGIRSFLICKYTQQ